MSLQVRTEQVLWVRTWDEWRVVFREQPSAWWSSQVSTVTHSSPVPKYSSTGDETEPNATQCAASFLEEGLMVPLSYQVIWTKLCLVMELMCILAQLLPFAWTE